MDPFLVVKWLHILSSTVLFGTGIGTAFQMVWAVRSNTPATIAHTASGVVAADWLFTTPAGILQPVTGLVLVYMSGASPFEPWLLVVYALYALAFLCWVPVVVLQIRIRDLARAAAALEEPLPSRARRYYALWFTLGWPAFGALIAIFWLMITRPVFN